MKPEGTEKFEFYRLGRVRVQRRVPTLGCGPLAPSAEQREEEPEPDGTRIQTAHGFGITLELLAVAFLLAVEKKIHSRAFVLRELEIDDPARPLCVDESAIEHDVRDRAIAARGQRVLAARIAMGRVEEPAPARIAEQAPQRLLHAGHCGIEVGGGDAFARELGSKPASERTDPSVCPGIDAVLGDLSP